MRFKSLLLQTFCIAFGLTSIPQAMAETAPFCELDAAFARAIILNQCASRAEPEEKVAAVLDLENQLRKAIAETAKEIPDGLLEDHDLFTSLGKALDGIRTIASSRQTSHAHDASHAHHGSHSACSHDHDEAHDGNSCCGGSCLRHIIHDAHDRIMAIRQRSGLTTRYDRLWDIQKASHAAIRTARHLGPNRLDDEGWKHVLESVDQTHRKMQSLLKEIRPGEENALEALKQIEDGIKTIRKSAEIRSETALRQGAEDLRTGFTTLALNPAHLPG